jgi:hypothetical protein
MSGMRRLELLKVANARYKHKKKNNNCVYVQLINESRKPVIL